MSKTTFLPQYTLRKLFGVMTVCAVIFTIVGFGIRGQAWAAGLSAALAMLALMLLIHAVLFALIWGVGSLRLGIGQGKGASPFRSDALPPPDLSADKDTPAAPIILD